MFAEFGGDDGVRAIGADADIGFAWSGGGDGAGAGAGRGQGGTGSSATIAKFCSTDGQAAACFLSRISGWRDRGLYPLA